MNNGNTNTSNSDADKVSDASASTSPVTNQPPKAFSKTLFRTLKVLAWITGTSNVTLTKKTPAYQWINPIQSYFILFITLSALVFGANLPKSFTKTVHPLVTTTLLTWLAGRD